MTTIRAIDTFYKGYKFRSRLEARWAVFSDTLGVEYIYEPEGYKLSCGWYLPDFWYPLGRVHKNDIGYFVEIKPTYPKSIEIKKAVSLSENTKHCVVFLIGNPWPGEFSMIKTYWNGNIVKFAKTDNLFTGHLLDEPYIAYPFGVVLQRKGGWQIGRAHV